LYIEDFSLQADEVDTGEFGFLVVHGIREIREAGHLKCADDLVGLVAAREACLIKLNDLISLLHLFLLARAE
jgi:hypothetical protein